MKKREINYNILSIENLNDYCKKIHSKQKNYINGKRNTCCLAFIIKLGKGLFCCEPLSPIKALLYFMIELVKNTYLSISSLSFNIILKSIKYLFESILLT